MTNPALGSPSAARDSEKKPESSTSSPLLTSHAQQPPSPLFSSNPANVPGFPGFPLVDMSSTHVLLNMVRNASAAQQAQLESYLKVAGKRPAENSSSPLDLSSVTAKRPRTELPKTFDVKNLFLIPSEEEKKNDTSSNAGQAATVKARHFSNPNNTVNNIPCSDKSCPTLDGVSHWTVDDVCNFVGSIDLCIEYVDVSI